MSDRADSVLAGVELVHFSLAFSALNRVLAQGLTSCLLTCPFTAIQSGSVLEGLPTPSRWHVSLAALLVAGAVITPKVVPLVGKVHRYLTTETPRLVYTKSPENEKLLERCETIKEYYPLWYLFNGHLQTIKLAFANEQEQRPIVDYERQLLDMPDGGVVSLDWALPIRSDGSVTPLSEIDASKRTMLIHPGLTGGSSEHYIRSVVHNMRQKGWQVVVMNARGCANTPLKTAQFFCIAYTADIRYTAKYLSEKYNFQSEALVGLGFSMGANVLVKYLGEEGERTPLTAGISVGNPFDVVKCSGNIDATLFNRLTYGHALNTSLLQLVFEKSNAHEIFQGYPGVDLEYLRQAKSLFDFDDRFTRILFKYESVPEFYTDASSLTRLPQVAVPLLCINAADDPISITIPSDNQILANPNVILCVTKSGGHLAFFEGENESGSEGDAGQKKKESSSEDVGALRTWSSRVIAEFAESVRLQRAEQMK